MNEGAMRGVECWKLQFEWRKNGLTSWVALKDLKESNPIEVAKYSVANKIAEKPVFAWWVHQTLCRCDLTKVKARYWSRRHKCGIELPKMVAEALMINDRTGINFWWRVIEKVMSVV